MNTKTLRTIVFFALLVHGIGHIQGVVGALGVKFKESSSSVSWLLKDLGIKTNTALCLILYLAAAVLGILTALSLKGIIFPQGSWPLLALLTAILSTLCLVLFPRALAMFFNYAGAVGVNLIIYYLLIAGNDFYAAAE